MKTTFKFEHLRDGEGIDTFSEDGRPPDLQSRSADDLGDMARHRPVWATACIYCGSTKPRSREHVIPKGWGGTLVIQEGSCEPCRELTSKFENRALNEGTMREVRRLRGWGSRSRHVHARETLPFAIVKDGERQVLEVPIANAPLLLGLPHFCIPGLLAGAEDAGLAVTGWSLASFGPDPDTFLREVGGSQLVFEEDGKRAVAFAQTLAKVAYGYAWGDGVYEVIAGREALLDAFMHHPEALGRFVGTKLGPHEQSPPNVEFSVRYTLDPCTLQVVMEVQPFADLGGPTYLVVLGRCASLREWRRVLQCVQASFYAPRRGRRTREGGA